MPAKLVDIRIYMNLLIIFMIPPMSAMLLFDHSQVLKCYNRMDREEQTIMLGGIGHRGAWFTTWFCTTYLLSVIGLCSSFYLHATGPVTWIPVLLFMVFHVSLVTWDVAVVKQHLSTVFVCLTVNVATYTILLVYTCYQFPALPAWPTHVCNMVLVVHALYNESYVWQHGWWMEIDDREKMAFCNINL
jgi:hypothetical protein